MQIIDVITQRFDKILLGVTTANAGVFTSVGFSISQTQGVEWEEILQCRNALSEQLGFGASNTYYQKQVHGCDISQLPDGKENTERISDAMICTQPNSLLCVSIADCAGVLLWNDEQTLIAGVHSGWRGTAQNIVGKTVQSIVEIYKVNAQTLYVWISPCAGNRLYEVGIDVAEAIPDFCAPQTNGKYLFDNRACIVQQLQDCGVLKPNIGGLDECAIQNTRFHSFRRDGEKSGRMAAFIGLKEM